MAPGGAPAAGTRRGGSATACTCRRSSSRPATTKGHIARTGGAHRPSRGSGAKPPRKKAAAAAQASR
eukprot:2173113-Pyramimonas_sp.AAC.1